MTLTTEQSTITTTISKSAAVRLIALAGGTPNERGGWNLYGEQYWQTDEALMVSLEEIADNNLGS